MIKFDPVKHRYTCEKTGKELISVTTLLGKYKPVFDKMENATRVANREGLDVEFVLDMWEQEKNRACDYGTSIHKVMEDYLVEGKEEDEYSTLYKSYDMWAKSLFRGYGDFKSEEQLFDLDNFIAGTADLIYENKDRFFIGDFKTNKRFNYTSTFNDYMLGPLCHLTVCEFNTYALQLSMYAYLYEKATNKKCAGCVIFYKDKSKQFANTDDSQLYDIWRPISVNYMKNDIIALINDYNNSTPSFDY
tara:strand:- start:3613 stop:4353 length:741 start_codon:yes stop_codon:yes gene_type:complete